MKSARSLRIPLIVLLILCLLFLTYKLISNTKQGKDDVTKPEGSGVELLNFPIDDIESVTVKKKNGDSFTISSGEKPTDMKMWNYFGPDGLSSELTYSQVIFNNYIASFASISSIERIDTEGSSLSEYGLESPEYVVEITMISGQVNQVFIGAYSIGNESTYIKINDLNEVHLVSAYLRNLCEYTYLDFLDNHLLSIPYDQVVSFSFRRKTDPIDVVLSPDDSDNNMDVTLNQWKFNSPFSFRASNKMSGFIGNILNLSIYKFLSSDTDIKDYGLDDPEYSFSINKTDGTEVEIFMSKLIGDYYYGMTNLSPNIFMVSQNSLSGLQIPLIEQISPLLFKEAATEVKSIEVTFPEGNFLLEMNIPEGESFLSAQSEIYINKRNAKVSDSDGKAYYEVLYNAISALKVSDLDFDNTPQNMKTISVKIIKKDGSLRSIDFSKSDSDRYYLFIDEIYMGFIVDKSELYGEDGTNYSDYGIWGAYELLDRALDGQMNGKYDIPEL